ncbi:MAG: L-threonylcarbamoyladenylate synthase [Pseudomonadota bacterium]
MIRTPTPETIADAATLLQQGHVIGLPTETVYGLAANALDGLAVARIFTLKQRPHLNPLIVHVIDTAMAARYGVMNDLAHTLAAAFWPGPLTLVMPLRHDAGVSPLATSGLETIALRVPAHPVAQAVLRACNLPLAAPSANVSGRLSPTAPQHVNASFGDALPLILAGGAAPIGLESTVVDATGDVPVLLRHGAITADDMRAATAGPVQDGTQLENGQAPRSPGQTLRHYAPRLPLRLSAVDVAPDEALLAFGALKFMGMRGGGFARDLPPERLRNLSETGDLEEAASRLFAALHDLETSGASRIAVMDIPATGMGLAIRDRLSRAADSEKETKECAS